MIVIIITVVIIMITMIVIMIVIIITTVVAVRSFRTLMCAHVPSITMRAAPVKHLGAVQWNKATFQRRPCGYSFIVTSRFSFIVTSRLKSDTCSWLRRSELCIPVLGAQTLKFAPPKTCMSVFWCRMSAQF